MMKHEEKLESFHFYRSMKLKKYGFGLKTSEFVSFLAWSGMMFGILAILFSLELMILPTEFVISYDFLFYIGGIVGILTSTIWLAINMVLRKRNVNKDFRGIRRIMKIKCCFTGSFEILLSILGIIITILTAVVLCSDYQIPVEYSWVCGLGFLLYLVFACFKIHGVGTENNKYINSYIVFNMINFVLCVALGMGIFIHIQKMYLVLSVGTLWILFILAVIVISFVFIYYMGPLVVLYNFNQHFDSKMYTGNLTFITQPFFYTKYKDERQSAI